MNSPDMAPRLAALVLPAFFPMSIPTAWRSRRPAVAFSLFLPFPAQQQRLSRDQPPIYAPCSRPRKMSPTWEGRIMLEPVILDIAIIDITKHWLGESIRCWLQPDEMTTI